jgi:hypothetical protein
MNLEEKRIQKRRGETPKQTLESVLNESNDIKEIVISYVDSDGYAHARVSIDSVFKTIGMLEISKQQLILESEVE